MNWLPLLPPLPVVGPLAVAGLLLMASHRLPRPVPDVVSLCTVLAALTVCVVLALHARVEPLVYWFGGWTPRQGFPLGIDFVVDAAGAWLSVFVCLLFGAALVFAWGYYDEVHAHFHVLMLAFMSGMVGFCLTHDLFNMFVWFEVMSVSAFALTGYQLHTKALKGALHFTVTNGIGSYLFLAGIGCIYARTGVLDLGAIGQAVGTYPADVVVQGAFALLAAGLLIKAAQVPFHFWLPDAHGVAPSPVSVIFSGAMVAIGIFGLARITWIAFIPAPQVRALAGSVLVPIGAASLVLGGVMCLTQRHIKRLLAFSTISHVGTMLVGMGLLERGGLTGMLLYFVGHGLVKGALFMVAGILLATRAGIDELRLRGQGRGIWPAGLAMAVGGLLLAGLPIGLMGSGSDYIEAAIDGSGRHWRTVTCIVGSACTGGAVLRVTGRVFFGLGGTAGMEQYSTTDDDREKADRPLATMLLPAAFLLIVALGAAARAIPEADRAAVQLLQPTAHADMLQPFSAAHTPWSAWLSVGLAIAIAAYSLGLPPLRSLSALPAKLLRPAVRTLGALHSEDVRDYVAWLTLGLAVLCAGLLGGLRP